MQTLATALAKVAKEFVYARGQEFTDHPLGTFIRKDLPETARQRLVYLPYDYKVKGSPGNGQWAAVPWLAFFDPLITTSATRGFYIVYLINAQNEEIYLSLNQGTTAVYREHGEKIGREVLSRRASDLRARASSYVEHFDTTQIDLGSEASLPAGYTAGHAFGAKYRAHSIDPEKLDADLEIMFSAYEHLIAEGGTTPLEVIEDEAGTSDVVEAKKYYLSKKIERAPHVREKVLKAKGLSCEGCGFTPSLHLNFHNDEDPSPLEVHHSRPLNQMSEGEERRYIIPRDFLVLCPTCHRIIHTLDDPSDTTALKAKLGFIPKSK